jgi:pilus assembly protein Flp/PilA
VRLEQIAYTVVEAKTRSKEVSAMLFLPCEDGQGLVEYALILLLVALVVIIVLALIGPQLGNVFSQVVQSLVI